MKIDNNRDAVEDIVFQFRFTTEIRPPLPGVFTVYVGGVTGVPGITSLDGGGKTWPSMTLPQMHEGIALILHYACQCGTMPRILYEGARRLQRNDLARLYHWKQRNRLAPLNINKRQF